MTLWLCEGTEDQPCQTLYAVGLYRCPRCHGTAFHEFGSQPEDEEHPMAKITQHGGPSNKALDVPSEEEEKNDEAAPAPESVTPAEAPDHASDLRANVEDEDQLLPDAADVAREASRTGEELTKVDTPSEDDADEISPETQSEPDSAAVREWARSQGIEVSDRGRIPAAVMDAYRAHPAEATG